MQISSDLAYGPRFSALPKFIRNVAASPLGLLDPNFVPTPDHVVELLIKYAEIQPGMKVLEPSAGSANIARRLRQLPITLHVLEINDGLRKVLQKEKYNVVGADFLKHGQHYDCIVMNPPFYHSDLKAHLLRAEKCLKSGGRLVSIVPNSILIGSDEFAKWFRESFMRKAEHFTLSNLGGYVFESRTKKHKKLPVETSILIWDKP